MPSEITLRTSGHNPAGEPRRSAFSSIQIMSPWAPSASQALSRSAVFGVASAGATPNAQKPSSLAFDASAARIFGLPFNIFSRYQPDQPGGRQSGRSSDRGQGPRQIL